MTVVADLGLFSGTVLPAFASLAICSTSGLVVDTVFDCRILSPNLVIVWFCSRSSFCSWVSFATFATFTLER